MSHQRNRLLFNRDAKWLKWHLDHFIKRKRVWIFLSTIDNKINGYTICIEKINSKKSIKSALLIDLMTFNNFDEIIVYTNANIIPKNENFCSN